MRPFLLPSALRRWAASLMLAALASFVLHGGGMAGHRHGSDSVGCGPTASAAHSHGSAAGHDHSGGHAHEPAVHDHGDGVVHVHPAQADAFKPGADASHGHHAQGGAEAPCCGNACAIAIPAFAPVMISLPMTAAVLLPASQDGAGIDPGALKRPPRTPCIA